MNCKNNELKGVAGEESGGKPFEPGRADLVGSNRAGSIGSDRFDPIGANIAHHLEITCPKTVPQRFNLGRMKTSITLRMAVRSVIFDVIESLGREAGIEAIMVFNREKRLDLLISGVVNDSEIVGLMDFYSKTYAKNQALPDILSKLNNLRFKLSMSVYFSRQLERVQFGDFESAENIYKEAKEDFGLFFTIFFFTEWIKRCKTFPQTETVYNYLNKEKVIHNVAFYTEWLKKTGTVKERIEVYERMIQAGITPDDAYCSAWIYMVESLPELSAVLDEVVDHGISPGAQMCDLIMSFAERFGGREKVTEVISEIMGRSRDHCEILFPLYRVLMEE